MKKLLVSAVLLLGASISSIGQVTEGRALYKIDITSDKPEMQMAVGMMQGSTLEINFKDNLTRSEMKMGTIVNIITVSDGKTEDMLMLMSGMVGQKAVKTNAKELKEEKKQAEPEVTLVDESKEVAGYTCKKAILTDAEGNESTYWYSEEIQVSKKGQNYLNEKIPGFPMEYELNQGPMKMTLTVDSFETKLPKKSKELFAMKIPEGYQVMTMDELKNIGM